MLCVGRQAAPHTLLLTRDHNIHEDQLQCKLEVLDFSGDLVAIEVTGVEGLTFSKSQKEKLDDAVDKKWKLDFAQADPVALRKAKNMALRMKPDDLEAQLIFFCDEFRSYAHRQHAETT